MRINNNITVSYALPFTALILLTVFSYWNISGHQFLHWDDVRYVLDEPHLHSLSLDNIVWAFTDFSQINWQPVTSLSFVLSFSLFDNNAVAFKIINIIIHLLNSILVFFIAVKIGARVNSKIAMQSENQFTNNQIAIAAFLSSLLFAIHPQHVESVAWVVERKDVLCALFYFAGIYSYIRQIESNNQQRWANATAIFFVLAIMSKSLAVTFPIVLMLLDILFNRVDRKMPLKRIAAQFLGNKLAILVASAGFAIVTIFTQRTALQEISSFGLEARIINACISMLHYLYTFFFPINLSPYYPTNELITNPSSASLLPIIGVIFIFYLAWKQLQKNSPLPVIALAYFFITLLPVVGLIKVGHAAYADRYTYIPSIGLHILASYWIAYLYFRNKYRYTRHLLAAAGVIYLSILVTTTQQYVNEWRDDQTLWLRAVDIFPYQSVVAYLNLGDSYYRNKKYNDALKHYKTALGIDPTNIDAMEHIAKVNMRLKNENLAEYYRKQLVIRNPESPKAHIILGDHYYQHNNLPLANSYYLKALFLEPLNTDAIFKNAVMDTNRHNYMDAMTKIDYILKLKRDHVGALQLLAQIHFNEGRLDDSISVAKKLLKIEPRDKFAYDLLDHIDTKNTL